MSTETALRNRKISQVGKEDEKTEQNKISRDTQNSTELKEKEQPKESTLRKMITRTIWGSLMMIVFSLIMFSDHTVACVLVIVIQVIMFKELMSVRYTEAKEKNLKGFRTLHWYILFSSFFYFYGQPVLSHSKSLFPLEMIENLHRYHLAISFTLYVIGFVGFIATLKKKFLKYQFSQLTWTLMTIAIVVVQAHLIIQNIFSGLFWFLFPCLLIICNDIMAYFCGLAFGRKFINRPLTKLSPNKTWEGFIGSLICTLIFAFLFSRFLAQYEWFICPEEATPGSFGLPLHCKPTSIFIPRDYELWYPLASALKYLGFHKLSINLVPIQLHGLILALFASLIAPFGGFFASGIKRAYGLKDFNSLFPGHGGMMDRMDCQLINGLFIYVYFTTFIQPSLLNTTAILNNIMMLPLEEQLKILHHLNSTLLHRLG